MDYEKQATDFLEKFIIEFRATWRGDEKCPKWAERTPGGKCPLCGSTHGDYFFIKLTKPGKGPVSPSTRLTFDFWGCYNDREKGVRRISAYDVLACISSDSSCPDTFREFCSEYEYDSDSRKAAKIFRQVEKFSAKLRKFFTPEEIEALQEIR